MYQFIAYYENMDSEITTSKLVEFDSHDMKEKDCFMYAMGLAYDNKLDNECLVNLEFISN